MSKLYFKYGTMNSGKTLEILRTAHNYEEVGSKVLIMKPAVDTKGQEQIVTRIGLERNVDLLIDEHDNIEDLIRTYPDINNVVAILIDEAQFLTRDQVDQLMQIVINLGISIMCYGLVSDFRTELFPGSARLLTIAHEKEEIRTMCSDGCNSKAMFNARYVDGARVNEGDQVCIDNQSQVIYRSLCPKCFYK